MDPRTLAIVLTLILLISTVSLLILWRINRFVPGLAHWAGGYGFFCLATLALALNTAFPVLFIPLAASIFTSIAFFLCWTGVRRFFNRKGDFFLPFLVAVGGLSMALIYVFSHDLSLGWRILTATALPLVFSLLMARELLIPSELVSFPARVLGWFSLLHGAFLLFRIYYGFEQPTDATLMDKGALQSVIFIEAITFTIVYMLGFILLTTERLQGDLARLAAIDPLTEVFNRRAFFETAKSILGHALRTNASVSIVLMDLDHFKKVNDTYGHAAGDQALKHFTSIAKAGLRDQDILSRFGGEEFVALLPDAHLDQAQQVAERLRSMVERIPTPYGEHFIKLTVSIGVAEARGDALNIEEMILRTDKALYEAKETGRNRAVTAANKPQLLKIVEQA